MIGRADADGVEVAILLVEHLPPVLIERGFRVRGLDAFIARGIDIRDGDQIDRGVCGDAVQGGVGHAIGAKEARRTRPDGGAERRWRTKNGAARRERRVSFMDAVSGEAW
jgi:hypothetical protein